MFFPPQMKISNSRFDLSSAAFLRGTRADVPGGESRRCSNEFLKAFYNISSVYVSLELSWRTRLKLFMDERIGCATTTWKFNINSDFSVIREKKYAKLPDIVRDTELIWILFSLHPELKHVELNIEICRFFD